MNIKENLYLFLMNGEEFERLFIVEALRLGEEIYGSVRAYGEAVWPEKSKQVAGQTMYNLKHITKTGKPQAVRLHEAVKMIEALNRRFASFCFEISEKIRLQNEGKLIFSPPKSATKKEQEINAPESTQTAEHEASDGC